MTPLLIALFGVILLFVLIALHVPIGPAMGIAGVVGFALLAGIDPALAIPGIEAVSAFKSLDLAIIPLFLLMGSLAAISGLSADLYNLVNAFIGHKKGGLAVATIGGCGAFGAVCGSSIATVATMTRVALPQMLAHGYRPAFAAGSIAAGGTLGIIIPPSLIIVIYAVLSEQFVLAMFAAAVVPGILAVLFQLLAIGVYARLYPDQVPAQGRSSWGERWAAVKQARAVILLGLLVTLGIYGGIVTVTEAAALGAVSAFILSLVRGSLDRAVIVQVARETAINSGMIYLVIIGAFSFSYFLALSGLPEIVVQWIGGLDVAPILIILALYLMYIALGAVFESVAAMVVTLPFVLPVIDLLGYDPIWWGVMLVMVSGLGMITPPIGMNIFVLHGMAPNLPIPLIFRGVVPFLIADLARILLLTFLPFLVTWLPRQMGLM
ncbi:putative TRAP transporter large permease protein [alpha proteobacterium Q-1]|nr:putative TRAP transporter large permease protein [alpha proteobacterium Q-1]